MQLVVLLLFSLFGVVSAFLGHPFSQIYLSPASLPAKFSPMRKVSLQDVYSVSILLPLPRPPQSWKAGPSLGPSIAPAPSPTYQGPIAAPHYKSIPRHHRHHRRRRHYMVSPSPAVAPADENATVKIFSTWKKDVH